MDKRKLENPLSQLMGLVGKQKKKIRKKLLSKLSRLPMGVILDTPSGRLKDTIVDRVEGLETTLAHMIPEISANMLIPVILLIYVFVLDWRMALVTGHAGILFGGTCRPRRNPLHPVFY